MNRVPSLDAKSMQAVYALWDELATFPAGKMDQAADCLFNWIAKHIGADNVVWIGAVRMLRGAAVKDDCFSGWRLRVRLTMKPDSPEYKKVMAAYYAIDHYRKGVAASPAERSRVRALLHSGMTGRTMLALAGNFRIYRLRDDWIDFEAFRKTKHYDFYYRRPGISDRMHAGFPLTADAESIFMIDRYRGQFSDTEKALAELMLRGIREFHRRLFLDHGLLVGETPITPLQQRILRGLLTHMSEKEIAFATGQKPSTMHKYVTALYSRFGVKGRTALMALWLGQS